MLRMGVACLLVGLSTACAGGTGGRPSAVGEPARVALASTDRGVDGATGMANVEPATPINTPSPDYPSWERQQASEGDVVVHFTILPTGEVDDVTASDSTAFASHVVSTVERWTFRPATKNGVPVATRRSAHFKFRLATAAL